MRISVGVHVGLPYLSTRLPLLQCHARTLAVHRDTPTYLARSGAYMVLIWITFDVSSIEFPAKRT